MEGSRAISRLSTSYLLAISPPYPPIHLLCYLQGRRVSSSSVTLLRNRLQNGCGGGVRSYLSIGITYSLIDVLAGLHQAKYSKAHGLKDVGLYKGPMGPAGEDGVVVPFV